MLTVTWQVAPQIVTLHLLFGMTTLGLLWWLWLTSMRACRARRCRRWVAVRGCAGHPRISRAAASRSSAWSPWALQLALGGWTSTNYAAIACPDFPTCQASWWPHMDFGSAFVLWHAPTVNYEGGVLGNAARIAIHFTHRLGATPRHHRAGVWRRCGRCVSQRCCAHASRPSPCWPRWHCS